MPRIIVRSTAPDRDFMNERVTREILEDEHDSLRVLERMAQAVIDAEEVEGSRRPRWQRLTAFAGLPAIAAMPSVVEMLT